MNAFVAPATRRLTVLLTPGDRRALREAGHQPPETPPADRAVPLPWLVFDLVIEADGGPTEVVGGPDEFALPYGLAVRIGTAPCVVWNARQLMANNKVLALYGEPPLPARNAIFLCDWARRRGEHSATCTDLFTLGHRGAAALIYGMEEAGSADKGRDDQPNDTSDPDVLRVTRHLRLLDRIGEGGETDQLAAVRQRVAPLLKPLPLLGDTDPDALQASLDAAFPWLPPSTGRQPTPCGR